MTSTEDKPVAISTIPDKPLLLLVDDQPINLNLLAGILCDHYRIKLAARGVDALKIAALEPQPDLILLDVMMPGLNGIEVMRRLRASPQTSHIPVIFISARASEEAQLAGLDDGADDYLIKPVLPLVLLARVKNVLRRRQAESALKQLNQELECRVRERTLTIAGTNNRLQATLDALPDLLFEVGLDGRIHHYHTNRSDLLAAPPEIFLGKRFSDILPHDVTEVCLAALREADVQGRSSGGTYALQLPNGRFWFEISVAAKPVAKGQDKRFIFISRDITRRKQAEEALGKSEEFLRSTIDGLSAQITVLDDQGAIILTNKAYRDFGAQNGVEPRTVSEGVNYLAVCDAASGEHAEEANPFAEGLRKVLSGEQQHFELEYACHSPDEKRWFIARVTSFRGEGPRCAIVAHENITERKQAEATVRDHASQLQALSRRVLEAQETERRRLAIELHDEFGQTLTALKFNLLAQAQHDPMSVEYNAINIAIVDQALQEVRALALALRPSMLDDLGLVPALRWVAEQRGDLVVRFDSLLPELRLAPEIEIACFRIVQEALTNIQRHAEAQQVTIELRAEDATLVLSVADDGCGFDPVAMVARAASGNSLGLLGMRERATLIGGTLEIESAAGRGCCVRLRCPLRLCEPA